MIETLKDWAGFVSFVISIGTAAYAFLTAGAKRCAADIEVMEKSLIDHDRRIQTVEGELKHLPVRDDVHRLELAIKDMQAELAAVRSSAEATARTSRRVEEFLLGQVKGSV